MTKLNVKRILHIVGAMNRAGTETMLMNIYRNIDREKVQFDFISFSRKNAHYDEEIKSLGGRVIKLSNTQSIKDLLRVIKEYGPYEAVHSHTLFHCGIANLAAKLAGIKIRVAHAHTTLDNSDSVIRKLYIRAMRVLIKSTSTHLLACSNEAGKYLFGNSVLKQLNYKFFPNLIDYSVFLKVESEQINHFKNESSMDNGIVIGHIGRFIESKNHKFLLNIMKNLLKMDPNITLLLVGDGDLKQEIEAIAKNENIYHNIKFVGIRNDISTMLHCMDVFVFPSIYEGLGLVLLEAQASGLPCIVSEAIQPEADLELGLVTRLNLNDEAEVWAKKILELANKKETETEKIIKGFKKKGYEMTKGISNLLDIYQV
ncbi:glycosyltransferase family 1 protein [Bacillus sp. JJ1521]|uniref:glycosyltransferase family 1 protein n=1 Tax=Bacillus sp. JJ1521 TaxID=3122957 RepID=UPI002FFEAA22